MTMPSRVAFTLFGKDIYWYGVLMAVAMIIAVFLAYSEERRKKLKKDTVIDMCLAVIPAGVVGARLYYVLFALDAYKDDPISVLYIWQGGLAIYGAVIAGLIAAFIFAKVRKIRFLTLADIIAPGLVLAQSIGRWGNFFNQEAYGLPVTPEMLAAHPILGYFPISVPIDGAHYFYKVLCTACATAANGAHLHLATFFYESAWCLLIFIVLWLTRKRMKHDGDTFFLYAVLYSFERMFVEGLRGDSLWIIKPSADGLTDGVRVSQALSGILFIAVMAFFIIRAVKEKKEGRLMWPAPELAVEAGISGAENACSSCEESGCSECENNEDNDNKEADEAEGGAGAEVKNENEAEADGEDKGSADEKDKDNE